MIKKHSEWHLLHPLQVCFNCICEAKTTWHFVEHCCLGLMAMVYGWINFCSTFCHHLCEASLGVVFLAVRWWWNIKLKKFSHRPSSPHNRVVHSTGLERLSQFINLTFFLFLFSSVTATLEASPSLRQESFLLYWLYF